MISNHSLTSLLILQHVNIHLPKCITTAQYVTVSGNTD